MKILLTFALAISLTHGIENLMNTDIQKCLNCLCHARTGCYSRFNCARYSISYDYWNQAEKPLVADSDDPNSKDSFEKCMKDENCILVTIKQYTESFGEIDCNCDEVFDCKDRFAIHLNGSNCVNPIFGQTFANRFNNCAKNIGVSNMLVAEGHEGCFPETFDANELR